MRSETDTHHLVISIIFHESHFFDIVCVSLMHRISPAALVFKFSIRHLPLSIKTRYAILSQIKNVYIIYTCRRGRLCIVQFERYRIDCIVVVVGIDT